jgi:hypothetical protein
VAVRSVTRVFSTYQEARDAIQALEAAGVKPRAMLGTGNLWQDVSVAGSGRGSITGALVGSGVPVDEAEALEQDVFGGRILVVIQGTYDAAMIDRILQTRATPP